MNKTFVEWLVVWLLALLVIIGLHSFANASQLSDVANSMNRGDWKQVTMTFSGDFFKNPTGTQAFQPSTQYMGEVTWDAVGKQLIFVGSGHQSNPQLMIYDEVSGMWSKDINLDPVIQGHAYYGNTIDTHGRRLGFLRTTPSMIRTFFVDLSNNNQITQRATSGNDGSITNVFVYFPERDLYFDMDGDGRKTRVYNYATDTWSVESTAPAGCYQGAGQPVNGYYHNFAVYNPVQKGIVFGGGNTSSAGFPTSKQSCLYQEDGSYVVLPTAPDVLQIGHAANGGMITVDPVSGDLLMLNNVGKLHSLNFETMTWTTVDAPAPFNDRVENVQDGFVVPISTYGVVGYLKYDDDNSELWLYKHASTANTVRPPSSPSRVEVVEYEPPPVDSGHAAVNTSFEAICALPTTIFCQDFNQDLPKDRQARPGAESFQSIDSNDITCATFVPGPDSHATCPQVADGALNFVIPSESGSGGAGSYQVRFSDLLGGPIGPGQTIYVQWRQKMNAAMIHTQYLPPFTGFKQFILGAADEFSCASNEIVFTNTNSREYHILYHGCGFNDSSAKFLGGSDFAYQPGGDRQCKRSDWVDLGNRHIGVEPFCYAFRADEWTTYQLMVQHGQPGEPSHIESWMGYEGEPQKLVISWDHTLRNNKGYGRAWWLPYMSFKDNTHQHEVGITSVDQIIISETRIPDPTYQ